MPLRTARTAIAFVAAIFAGLYGRTAHADNMDPVTERLVLQPQNVPVPNGIDATRGLCQQMAANPELAVGLKQSPNAYNCAPANVAFANLANELGFAIAPTAFHPARTTGIGGFALTVEASYTKINNDAFSKEVDGSAIQYWHQGTRGATDPNSKSFSTTNNSPDSILQVYTLKARKGLPLGFEIAGALGYVANTTLWVVGADVRWAPLEGFRTGALGILPDLAVGGGVRTLMGTSKMTLTTVGADVQISKPIPIASSGQLTPYVGYQHLWIYGDSNIIDSTPNTDPLAQCGYQGPDPSTGAPVCKNKLSNGADNNSDFNNNFVFQKVRTEHNRGIIGMSYRYEFLFLAGQFLVDLTPTVDDNPVKDATGNAMPLFDGRQWTLSFEAGVYF
jgi:hypothetical protein